MLRWLSFLLGLFLVFIVLGYIALQFYKPVILESVNRYLKNEINGDFQIGRLDFTIFEGFPNLSVTLSDIYLRGPRYARYHKDFLYAEKVYVHVRAADIFFGTVNLKSLTIRNGSIFIFRTKEDYSNLEVFKVNKVDTTATTSGSPSFELGNILFQNTRFTFVDSLKRKSFDVAFMKTTADFASTDSSRSVLLKGPLDFGGLMFNEQKGAYLYHTTTEARLDLEFIPMKKRLIIRPSELKFTKSNVDLSGQFDFEEPGNYSLNINSERVDYAEGLTLITAALRNKLSKFQFNAPIKLSVALLGQLTPGNEPLIDIGFSSQKNHFVSGDLEVTDFSCMGNFINHVDSTGVYNDSNSRITLNEFSGRVEGIPTSGKLTLTDLINPALGLSTRSQFGLRQLNLQSDTTMLRFISGDVDAKIEYEGQLKEYLDSTTTKYHGKLKGLVLVNNGAANMVPQKMQFDHANVRIQFTEKQMDLEKINFRVNGNSVQVNGKVKGFVPFFLQPEKKGYVSLSLYSPRIDMSTFIKKKIKIVKKMSRIRPKKISDFLDVLYSKIEFDLNMKADEVLSGSLRAEDVSGKLSLVGDHFSANDVKLKTAGGQVLLSLKMSDLENPLSPVVMKAEVRDADIKEFFNEFNNFSQTTITAQNLSGKFSTGIQLRALVDDDYGVPMSTVTGDVDFKIKDGRLQDFEPLQKMSNFLFKKRDFTDVQFAEIRSHFQISGRTLNIARMEIESSVLTLFLEGRYSLADSTDLSIQVPVSNLKKRDKTYQPENVGVDTKVGPSIFLHVSKGKDGKMAIAYDPFKKFKGKKK